MKYQINIQLRIACFLSVFISAALGMGWSGETKFGTPENPYPVPKIESDLRIDGSLDEEAWNRAVVIELNYEIRPRENVTPPVRTEMLLLYGKTHFYIGFRCYDPDPSQIRAHFSQRDQFGGDDWVAVEIDTYNDSRRAFTLFSTPLGGQADGISDAAGIKDYNWDMIYESAGRIHEWGYGVEMAIPFSSLRFQRSKGPQVWAINGVRGYPRDVMYQIWSQPYDRGNTCRVCQYTKIEGFEGVSPGRNIEINPTVTGTRTDEREDFPAGNFSNRNKQAEAGLTARWGITPNMVMSGTLNPDFSQVEADSAQLDINQPFALFYPERRPFFTEGLDFFRSPLNVIYTRTMRDPYWGIKLSGKEGDNAVGAYMVRDDITNLIFPGNQYSLSTSLQNSNTSSVIRYGRDLPNNSNLGILFTNRMGGGYHNRVYGLDGNLRLTKKDEFVLQILGSSTKYDQSTAAQFQQPDGPFGDHALSAAYVRKTRLHNLSFGFEDIGENFRADLGFLPQVGYRRFAAASDRIWRPKTSTWWTQLQLKNSLSYSSACDGTLLEKSLNNSFSCRGPMQSTVTLAHNLSRSHYNGTDFTLNRINLASSIIPTGSVMLSLNATLGDGIDYTNTRKGTQFSISPYIVLNIGSHLLLNLYHAYEIMSVLEKRLYTANISQAAVIYHFNSRLLLRTMLQYYDYDYNVSNYLQPRDSEYKRFFTQILLSYKFNPRTVLFLGCTDNFYGGPEYGLTNHDYTFFLKIGYAWVI